MFLGGGERDTLPAKFNPQETLPYKVILQQYSFTDFPKKVSLLTN